MRTEPDGPEDLTSSSPQESSGPALPVMRLAVVGALLVLGFWPIVTGLYGSWFDEHANMEHGMLVLPTAAYMVWRSRARLREIPVEPSAWGIVLLLAGAAQAMLGLAAHWLWISRTAILVSIVGGIAAIHGFRMVRGLAYPITLLLLMITPPTFIYERITLNLQLLASRLGESCLEALGYPVLREGNILELVGTRLSVQEACSGIRSLFSILFVCAVYDYFFVRANLMRAMILLTAVPIAVLGNIGRIVAIGVASQRYGQLGLETAHVTFGYIAVLIGAAGCVVSHLLFGSIHRAWRSRHA